MKHTSSNRFLFAARDAGVIVSLLLLISGCATGVSKPPSGVSLPGGGGVSIPGGGSDSGGGSSGGGSSGGAGLPGGGSSGGGSSGGGMGMPGGDSSGGGSSGGGSSGGAGMPGGGTSGSGGAGSTMGGQGSIPQVGVPGGDAAGCNDGGISGGGFGGGMGCDGDPDRAEELGKELDKSVGDFDEALGEEQRQVSSVGRNTEGFGDGASGSGGTISLGEQAAGASGGSGGSGAGSGGAAGSSETQAGPLDGISDEEIQSRTPDDIDATAYDDIVARQLREAALAEDDPELRDRLWEEYRKYKGIN